MGAQLKALSIAVALLVAAAALPSLAEAQSSSADQERAAAIRQLNWQGAGSIKLPTSHATLSVPAQHRIVLGEDARRFQALLGNKAGSGIEAVTFNNGTYDQVIFESFSEGYVRSTDWNEIDAKAMLEAISANTEERNKERQRLGVREVHVLGWLQEPAFDRPTNTVYWSFNASSGDHQLVNAVALRLGRQGFEKLTWVTSRPISSPRGGELDEMLRSHSFDEGYRYADFTSGDKIAAYTIAGLVASVAGGKALKVMAAGGLFLLLKKFGVFAVAGAAGLLFRIKRLFRQQ